MSHKLASFYFAYPINLRSANAQATKAKSTTNFIVVLQLLEFELFQSTLIHVFIVTRVRFLHMLFLSKLVKSQFCDAITYVCSS